MNSAAAIVSTTKLDTNTFLSIVNQALGREIHRKVDGARNLNNDEARFVSLLTAITNPTAKPGLTEAHSDHIQVGVLGICSAGCQEEVTTCLSGLSLLIVPTVSAEHTLFLASGDLTRWKRSVVMGLASSRTSCCRSVFNDVRGAFIAYGLNLWTDMKEVKDTNDCLYLTTI